MKILFKLFALSGAATVPEAKESACADGIHAHEENCNMYFQCANGHRYPDQSCPEGLLFNSDESVCDWPENVDCGCEDGIHAHETRCDAFYQCANGHRYPDQECPEGLMYNSEKAYCDWPENVDCGSEPSTWECYRDCVGDKWWNPILASRQSCKIAYPSVSPKLEKNDNFLKIPKLKTIEI